MDLQSLKDIPAWQWPRGLENKLLPILKDKNGTADPDDRLVAAEMAGDYTVINDALANALLTILENPAEPDELRATAAISFGAALETADIELIGGDPVEFEDPESVPISLQVFHKIQESMKRTYYTAGVPKLTRRRILEAAVRAEDNWQEDAVRAAYAEEDPEWKLTAVFCMKYVKGFDAEIVEALENPDPEIRYHAVEAAGNRGVDAAWPHISALAVSPQTEEDLRFAAIEALANIRTTDSIPILAELADDADEDIAEAAEEALSMARGSLETGEEDDFDEDEEFGEEDDEEDEDDKPIVH